MQNIDLEKEKERILVELFRTGRIDGLYFGKPSRLKKVNPLKVYIERCLRKSYLLGTNGINSDEFAGDIYMEVFLHLSAMPAKKFVDLYNDSNPKGRGVIGTALRIIILKCFTKGNGNPSHSLLTKLGYASVFNSMSIQINPFENDRNEPDDEEKPLIIYDEDYISDFEEQYAFSASELIELMTPEERFVMDKLLGKQKRGTLSKEAKAEKEKFAESVKNLKTQIENKNNWVLKDKS